MRFFPARLLLVLIVATASSTLLAQPVINEFLASNNSIYPDNCDFEDYSDWVELYNPASTNVSLANHYLTDDLTQPFKWVFPATATIAAHGYLMVRADGWDAGPGETRLRGYWPWDSTFVTRRYHASFKLSATGEQLGLYRTALPPQDVTLIASNAVWQYRDLGTAPAADWMALAYDDSTWAQGPAQLGYGDGDEATVVSYGSSTSRKYPATYFRHRFTVTDPARLGNLRFRVIVDDGAVLYLNGAEITRLRMPTGTITHTNYASGQPPIENAFEIVELPRSLFRAGTNVLAAEVHQTSASSSDISWAAELIVAEVPGPAILVDSVTFEAQTADVSYGRNATNGWSFFALPTPEGPNVTEALVSTVPAPEVSASLASGFYGTTQTVTLSAAGPASVIHYTLDSSLPGPKSPAYTNALTITANTILRARAFATGLLPGPVLTRTIFINEPTNRTLPVLSFVADPATLFDPTIGIYTNSTAYPFKGREVPARAEFFTSEGAPGFAVSCGIRIGGENIWRFAQKPLNIHMRGKYGDDVINYQVFPGEAAGQFGELNVRNGGDNWNLDMLRDAMMPSLLRGQAENGLSSYRPAVVFLNGRYWGVHDIRKQFDPVFFANEHHLTADGYDLVQYAHDSQGIVTLMADTGSTEAYETFHTFYTTHKMSQTTNYSALLEMMNVDSFIDYVVANDFGVNTSWPWNREFWCAHAPGSKWQWNVPDFDRCFNTNNLTSSLIDDFRTSYPLFTALTNSPGFVNRLLQRYAAHLGSTFYSNRFIAQLDALAAEVEGEMPRHIARWAAEGGIPSLASRETELGRIRRFVVGRPPYAVSRLQLELGLSRGQTNVTLLCDPPTGGNIRVAGVPMTPQFNTTIALFRNTPVELSAEAAPGYRFLAWSNGDTNRTIELTPTAAMTLTARFESGAETVLPSSLDADTTLTAADSPYSITNDLVVATGRTLTIGPGVTLNLPAAASIYVHGTLLVHGTTNDPVRFLARDTQPWGNLCFVNASGPCTLSNFVVRGATRSRLDPVNLYAAVSAYRSTLTMDGADIEAPYPVYGLFGSTTLRHSRIHIQFTGDGFHVKAGTGWVEGTTFTGAPTPDTDAIDYDSVTNGVVLANRIYAFRGSNSDAIDLGEGAQNILVISNRIYNIFDKAVSVGQASVARIERNLIVNCEIGVGVKDFGSTAHIDQNTFAQNQVGVAAYEKNLGHGGGLAYITNCIFSRNKTAPITVDSLSTLAVRYSLSDTLPLAGTGNLLADPLFTDAGIYDFSLTPASPAINTGDPAHPLDRDGSRADMGAYYAYQPNDYPYLVPNLVVLNEVMAHSHDDLPDWIELHNNSAQPVDLSGWYLSDSISTPLKYRIADGTILPPNGYLVFYEDLHFGAASVDPGALIPFALSENGEFVNLFGPSDGLRPDYTESEDFGASATGVSFGRYFKASTRTYNFVAMATPTPGAANSAPLVGPVVISEIMYHPPVADAEYLELVNVTTNPVMLFDTNTGAPWKMTQGITHTFPTAPPLTLAAGERILLVRSATVLAQNYPPPPGTRVFQWASGGLDNNGETLELSKPGDTNSLGVRQYVRVDRVDYTDTVPWPTGPDGSGTSLVRVNERAYGNDFANWAESIPTPGQNGYQHWAGDYAFPAGQNAPDADPDGDHLPNAMEYALGTHPLQPSTLPWEVHFLPDGAQVSFRLAAQRPDVAYLIQRASHAALTQWEALPATLATLPGPSYVLSARDPVPADASFYRLVIVLLSP